MHTSTKLSVFAALLLLVGAGCAPAANPPANVNESETQEETTETSSEETAMTGSETVDTTVELDDTWKTYVNAALKFDFRWPTKGANAPQWAVKFVPEKDASVSGECVGEGEQRKLTANGVAFCHTSAVVGDARTDRYATKNGSQFIVLVFTKNKPGEGYQATLDQIVSTFKYAK